MIHKYVAEHCILHNREKVQLYGVPKKDILLIYNCYLRNQPIRQRDSIYFTYKI